jgi:hypothetical protein
LVFILSTIVVHQSHRYRTKIENTIKNYVPEQLSENVERVPFFDDPNTNREQIKIDWHDYAFMKYEASRVGLGEQGEKVELNPMLI